MKSKIHLMFGLFTFVLSTQAFAGGVLILGDSHLAGTFGRTLDTLVRSHANVDEEIYGVSSATARTFFTKWKMRWGYFFHVENHSPTTSGQTYAPQITPILERMQPDLTIIELGTNYAPVGGYTDAFIVSDLKKLVKTVKENHSKCVLVSMPDVRKLRSQEPRILKLTAEAVGDDCTLIDSTKLTHYPDGEGAGIHYDDTLGLRPIAKRWAEQVFEQVAPILDSMIK